MRKGQVWYGDFILATIIFAIGLVIYYNFLSDFTQTTDDEFDNIIQDAQSISSQFVLSGQPVNWVWQDVRRIGFTTNNQIMVEEKIIEYTKLNYNQTKNLLGTIYEYYFFFINKSEDTLSVEGSCGFGSPNIETGFTQRAAHVISGEGQLTTFLNRSFSLDTYQEGVSDWDIPDLRNNLSKYDIIVLEEPTVTYSGGLQTDLENYIDTGGTMVFIGDVFSTNGDEIAGATYWTKGAQADLDRNATVITHRSTVPLLNTEQFLFDQAHYVVNESIAAENFSISTQFGDGDQAAIAQWAYGEGQAMFISHLSSDYTNGNFTSLMGLSVAETLDGVCVNTNFEQVSPENTVKIERFVIYQGELVKLILYVWG